MQFLELVDLLPQPQKLLLLPGASQASLQLSRGEPLQGFCGHSVGALVEGLGTKGLIVSPQLAELSFPELPGDLGVDQLVLELAHPVAQALDLLLEITYDLLIGCLCLVPLPRGHFQRIGHLVCLELQLPGVLLQL